MYHVIVEFWSIIGTIFGVIQLVNMGAFLVPYRIGRRRKARNVRCVVVTTGEGKVLKALNEVVSRLEGLGLDYVILSSRPLPFKNVIVVPPERDGSKYRAIKYFAEEYARDDYWYVFLDDDSYPEDDGFLYDIAYFSERDPRYAVGNGVIRPRPGRSRLAYALDWARYFYDLTNYRLAAILKRPIYGLHGELLIVRGDVLREIWPEMEESITEDFNFAMHIMKRGYWFFQSRTIVSVKSPNSMRDFIRQRRRWANVFYDAVRHGNLLFITYIISGILISPLLAPTWLIIHSITALIAGLYYWLIYTYVGLRARLPYAPLLLFASAAEVMALLLGILRRYRVFVVIDKS